MSASVLDLRIHDIYALLVVQRLRSMSKAARELRVTPSCVSKSLSRLEAHFGTPLLVRSGRGVELSDAGLRLLPVLERVLSSLEQASGHRRSGDRVLTIAAPSYLGSHCAPMLASKSTYRFRFIQIAPPSLRASLSTGLFDMALSLGDLPLPSGWSSRPLGIVEKGIFASPRLRAKLGPAPVDPEALLDTPFVMPVNVIDGRFVSSDDDCPLPRSRRRAGHEVPTIQFALAVAAASDQLVFGPAIAAGPWLARGELVRVPVRGWVCRDPLVLSFEEARMPARELPKLVAALRASLDALGENVLVAAS